MDNEALMRHISATTGAWKAPATLKPEKQPSRLEHQEPVLRESRPVAPAQPAAAPPLQPTQPVPQLRGEPPPAQHPAQPDPAAQVQEMSVTQPAPQPQVMQQAVADQLAATTPSPSPQQSPAVRESTHVPASKEPLMSFLLPEWKEEANVPVEKRMHKDARPEAYVIACNGNMAIVRGIRVALTRSPV